MYNINTKYELKIVLCQITKELSHLCKIPVVMHLDKIYDDSFAKCSCDLPENTGISLALS